MSKKLSIILFIVVSLVVAGCSKGNDNKGGESTPEVNVTPKEMVDKMLEEVEQPALMELDDQGLNDMYGISADKVESYDVRIPLMNVKTNEIAVFKVKEESDVADIEAAIKTRAENIQQSFENYLPDQYEIAKDYKLVTKGKYIFFVVSEEAEELVKLFENNFK